MTSRRSSGSIPVWGIAWGVAVSFFTPFSTFTPEALGSASLLLWWLIYFGTPFWCALGCLLVWGAEQGERIRGARGVLVACLTIAVLGAALIPLLSLGLSLLMQGVFPIRRFTVHFGLPAPTRDLAALCDRAVFDLWSILFLGGLLVVTYVLAHRAERTRALLTAVVMTRNRTEGLINAARLDALEHQIDPKLLLQCMQELKQRYRADPDGADRLLEALVEFLRFAMRGLHERVSTLQLELRLAEAYAVLQRERGVAGSWHVDANWLPASPMPFPSLLMLRLLALGGEAARPTLRTAARRGAVQISLRGLADHASSELHELLCVRLRGLYGKGFRVECSPAAATVSIDLDCVS